MINEMFHEITSLLSCDHIGGNHNILVTLLWWYYIIVNILQPCYLSTLWWHWLGYNICDHIMTKTIVNWWQYIIVNILLPWYLPCGDVGLVTIFVTFVTIVIINLWQYIVVNMLLPCYLPCGDIGDWRNIALNVAPNQFCCVCCSFCLKSHHHHHHQTARIPYSYCCSSCSVTKSALCTLHCNQAWYHRSAGVKTTGKNSE